MSLFSEKLKNTIADTGMTVYALAKKAGVNRPMIHKSQQGDVVPNDEFIEKIAAAMMLTDGERKELLFLAGRARMGEALYLKREAVLNIVNCLCQEFIELDVISLRNNPVPLSSSEGYTLLRNHREIMNVVDRMFRNAADGNEPDNLIFYLPSHAKELLTLIYNHWQGDGTEKLRLVQIIGLEKEYRGDQTAVNNLELISCALNYSLTRDKEYDAFYHYLDFPDEGNLPAMPFYVKTRNGVLVLSSNMKDGVYYGQGAMLDFYSQVIDGIVEMSKPLILYETELARMFNYGRTFTLIESIPCISTVMRKELVDWIVRSDIPGREQIVEIACDFYHQMQTGDKHPVSFFQMDKLERFMEEGLIPVVPLSLIKPLKAESRLEMLKGFRKVMDRQDKTLYYALNPNKVCLSMDAEIVWSQEKGVMIRVFEDSPAIQKTVLIQEPSCVQAFSDFFEYLPQSDIVLDQDEMKNQMDQLIGKYEQVEINQ